MAEIQPNDIGLATFNDVGDVTNLKTNAKEVVAAINELFANSRETASYEQLFVEGEDNKIFGSGNVIFGNGNRVFGEGNIIVGDNHIVIGSNKRIAGGMEGLYFDWVEAPSKRIYFFLDGTDFHLQEGDRVVLEIYQSWSDANWETWVDVRTGLFIASVTEVNLGGGYIEVDNMPLSNTPPDDVHTSLDSAYVTSFFVLREEYKRDGNEAVTMGAGSSGAGSFTANIGNASGLSSTAVNSADSQGSYSFACNNSTAASQYSFSANQAVVNQTYSAAFNNSECYGNNSVSFNHATTAGRAIKCISMSAAAKTLTAASGENLTGLAGNKVLIRYRDNSNSIIYTEARVTSVSGQTIYLSSDTYLGWGNYGEALVSDGYVFRIEAYNGNNLASGLGMAGGPYAQAHGLYTIAAHAGSVTCGKYGTSPEEYSWSLANGTSLAAQGLAVKILQNGDIHADGTLTSPCADYSELFEWLDGNPDNEDRAGYFVKLVGDKITIADEFDTPLGVISATPAIIGDSGEMHWHGKYLTDDFGRVKYHDVVIPAEKDSEGNIIAQERIERQPILNPEWDSTQEYVPRLKRPEWATVGVLGKLIVYDDGTLQSGDLCRCGNGGKAVKSITNGYQVLKRISEDKVLIWFRG